MSLALHEMLEALYGVKSRKRVNYLVAQVEDEPTRILPGDPNRLSFVFVNLSANPMYIAPQRNLTHTPATVGIYIAPTGGSIILQWDRDFELVSEEWWAISTIAASPCYILENISS